MFHISPISTRELWLSVRPQVGCTSAQMICVGEKHRRYGKNSCRSLWTQENSLTTIFHSKQLAVWSNDTLTLWQFTVLVSLASFSGGGGKPEASVVKETPNFRGEGEQQAYNTHQVEMPYFDLWHPFLFHFFFVIFLQKARTYFLLAFHLQRW